jgi:exonuclease III
VLLVPLPLTIVLRLMLSFSQRTGGSVCRSGFCFVMTSSSMQLTCNPASTPALVSTVGSTGVVTPCPSRVPVRKMHTSKGLRRTTLSFSLLNYNCRSLYPVKMTSICSTLMTKEFEKVNMLCLTEVRQRRDDAENFGLYSRFHWLFSQASTYTGFGIAISGNVLDYWIRDGCLWGSVADRVIWIVVAATSVIVGYSPTSQYDSAVVEKFYDDIALAIEEARKAGGKRYIVCGDFNARINVTYNETKLVGRFAYTGKNRNSEPFVDFVQRESLFVMNSFFRVSVDRKTTWRHASSRRSYCIDHILASHKSMVHMVRVRRDKVWNGISDHLPQEAKVCLWRTFIKQKEPCPSKAL